MFAVTRRGIRLQIQDVIVKTNPAGKRLKKQIVNSSYVILVSLAAPGSDSTKAGNANVRKQFL